MPESNEEHTLILPDLNDLEEIARVFPYLRTVITGVRLLQAKRLKWFLRALERKLSENPSEAKARLHKILSDPKAAELLAEYSEAVIRTSSRLANAALALLYADQADLRYTRDFKSRAAMAFRGIEDRTIKFFLVLAAGLGQEASDTSDPYQRYYLGTLVNGAPALAVVEPSPEGRFQMLFELQRRGLLLPDWSSGGWGGGESGFGIGRDAASYRDLLIAATDALATDTVEEG